MEETLEASLARIFQGEAGTAPVTEAPAPPGAPAAPPGVSSSLIRQAAEAYDRAVQAQRAGDWAAYGEEIKRLGAILQQLQKEKQ